MWLRPYELNDFYQAPAWLLFRIDAQVKNEPIDIYFLLDLPSGHILTHELTETMLTEAQTEQLLKRGEQKVKMPKRILLTKGDPLEQHLAQLTQHYSSLLELVPADYLEQLVAPAKQSLSQTFFSTSCYQDDQIDPAERQAIKQLFPDSYDLCSCASGKKYKFCCKKIMVEIMESMIAWKEGHIAKALQWIAKAKEIVGETAEVLCRESIVYSDVDEEKSNEILKKCLTLNPIHPRAHYLMGIDLKEKKDYQGAIHAYEKAIAHYPETDHYHLNETYNNLGSAFYLMGDYKKAKIAWEKAILYQPSDPIARQNLIRLMNSFVFN